ncbi:MAG: lipocalin family protein [Chthoniobacterales bacterium]
MTTLAMISAFGLACCDHSQGTEFVGTWKFENEEYREELTLNADHSFASIRDDKNVISHPSVAEENGTWQVKGGKLRIDAAWLQMPSHRRARTGHFNAGNDRLVVSAYDGAKSQPYERLRMPRCPDAASSSGVLLEEMALGGSWWMHFETRDYQLRLLPDHQMVLLEFSLNDWHPEEQGDWRIDGTSLIMRMRDAKSELDPYQDITWIVTKIGADCFVAEIAGKDERTLRRTKESNAPPVGASRPTPAFPLPTETPSPAR